MLRINDKKINTSTTLEAIKVLILFIEKYLIKHIEKHTKINRGRGYFHMIYAYLLTLEILEKEGFTEDSTLITDYLKSMNYTSQSILNHFLKEGIRLPSISEDKYAMEAGHNFLDLLKKINSIKNTSYGYEGFLLK
jgi:hypothetical protein